MRRFRLFALRIASIVGAALLIAACSSVSTRPDVVAAYWDDGQFAAEQFTPVASDVLAISDEMRAFVDSDLRSSAAARSPMRHLLDALYSSGRLHIQYDASLTRTASQTFRDRRGDCLSLVLMTAAFARELGVPVRFQQVLAPEMPIEDGDLLRMVGHVNIALAVRTPAGTTQWTTVDFLPPDDASRLRNWPVSTRRILAMYFNNKAVEATSEKRYGEAYWWTRASINQEKQFASAYVTLGVLWSRAMRPDLARLALSAALAIEPSNINAQANLASLGKFPGTSAPPIILDLDSTASIISLLKNGKADDAVRAIRDRLGREDSAALRMELAVAYDAQGRRDEAIRQLEIAQLLLGAESTIGATLATKLARLRARASEVQ